MYSHVSRTQPAAGYTPWELPYEKVGDAHRKNEGSANLGVAQEIPINVE